MEQISFLKVRSSYLKKVLMKLKITILTIVFGASYVFASPDTGPVNDNGFAADEVQQIIITGTVTDASTGEAMPGVNVLVKGTTLGALTDLGGKFSLAIPDANAVLVISFIGYDTQEMPVAGRSTVNIAMLSAIRALDEVIVTGYGTQKKSDLTGSVVRVSMEEKATLANLNLSQAL